MLILFAFASKAQEQKAPVVVVDAPTLFNIHSNPNYDYADQGRRMYINNSQFQNKDNVFSNPVPTGNGQYITPGNSNPVNQDLNSGEPMPSGTIYSGYIPVRSFGNPPSGSGGYVR